MVTIDALRCTTAFPQWSRAFGVLTGLEVHLLDEPTLEPRLRELTESVSACRCCRRVKVGLAGCSQHLAAELKQADPRRFEPRSVRCIAGATLIAYPFPLADGSRAFLCLGPVRPGAPDVTAIQRRHSGKNGGNGHPPRGSAPVAAPSSLEAAVLLLGLLAGELAHHSRRLLGEAGHDVSACAAVRRCRAIIELRFTENLHINQVAREIGVSRAYLSHAFLNSQGISFTDCLAGRRVAEMQRLLEDSALTVTEAMFAAGFQSIAQANRVFRKVSGISPREFRRQHPSSRREK